MRERHLEEIKFFDTHSTEKLPPLPIMKKNTGFEKTQTSLQFFEILPFQSHFTEKLL